MALDRKFLLVITACLSALACGDSNNNKHDSGTRDTATNRDTNSGGDTARLSDAAADQAIGTSDAGVDARGDGGVDGAMDRGEVGDAADAALALTDPQIAGVM